MLKEMADAVIFPIFVNAACFAHDFYGEGVCVIHGCENHLYSSY
ncbi:MAG: hypothetical protein WCJ45_03265 [bacterium]